MALGTVKFYNTTKGYGFIKVTNTGEEIFVHANELVDPIKENDTVEFDIVQGKKGPTASSVKKVRA
jgi:CspA family cold shock protein